jgi:hypothetical protein
MPSHIDDLLLGRQRAGAGKLHYPIPKSWLLPRNPTWRRRICAVLQRLHAVKASPRATLKDQTLLVIAKSINFDKTKVKSLRLPGLDRALQDCCKRAYQKCLLLR